MSYARRKRKKNRELVWHKFHSLCYAWLTREAHLRHAADEALSYRDSAIVVAKRHTGSEGWMVKYNGAYSPVIRCASLQEAKQLALNPEIELLLSLQREDDAPSE